MMISTLTLLLIGILGWCSGAVVNYLSDVLPLRRCLVYPLCLGCESRLDFWNYFLWPRRCSFCGRVRPIRVWLVELVYIVLTVWLWQAPPARLGFWAGWLLLVYFGLVVVIDLEHRLILHPVSLVGAVLSLGLGVYLHGWGITLLGGLGGFGSMFLIYLFGVLLMILLGRLRNTGPGDYEALGFGDVILSGVLGLLLGWPGILAGLFLAILLGGVVSLLYLIAMILARRYRSFSAIPYGPFLVAGAAILIYFHDFVLTILQ